jgi:hypothetical protein
MILDTQAIVDLHVKTFGVEPVITGINFRNSDKIDEWIIQSILEGKPYVEDEVPDDILT